MRYSNTHTALLDRALNGYIEPCTPGLSAGAEVGIVEHRGGTTSLAQGPSATVLFWIAGGTRRGSEREHERHIEIKKKRLEYKMKASVREDIFTFFCLLHKPSPIHSL